MDERRSGWPPRLVVSEGMAEIACLAVRQRSNGYCSREGAWIWKRERDPPENARRARSGRGMSEGRRAQRCLIYGRSCGSSRRHNDYNKDMSHKDCNEGTSHLPSVLGVHRATCQKRASPLLSLGTKSKEWNGYIVMRMFVNCWHRTM